ncbi:MAG: carboxymuconolactone decarboxylase family protein [Polyangiales bacterium]
MLQLIENQLFDQMRGMVRHITPVPPGDATGLVADVYAQMRSEFQLAPPFTLHSPAPSILAGVWSAVRESEIAKGHLPRVSKEAIAAAVSRANECPYCVDAHTGLLQGASHRDAGRAIRNRHFDRIPDVSTRALVQWASATRRPDDPIVASPPFAPDAAPEAIGTSLAFHYINRMVHVFLGDGLLPGPSGFRGAARHVFGATFAKRIVQRGGSPGGSLGLLPVAPVPPDFAWAERSPSISAAWSRFVQVVEDGGERSVPGSVQKVVEHALTAWRGDDPGLVGSWLDQGVAPLDDEERPLGRLLLTTALASYRVNPDDVGSVRAEMGSDTALIEATAWASLRAARRVGDWLQ